MGHCFPVGRANAPLECPASQSMALETGHEHTETGHEHTDWILDIGLDIRYQIGYQISDWILDTGLTMPLTRHK